MTLARAVQVWTKEGEFADGGTNHVRWHIQNVITRLSSRKGFHYMHLLVKGVIVYDEAGSAMG